MQHQPWKLPLAKTVQQVLEAVEANFDRNLRIIVRALCICGVLTGAVTSIARAQSTLPANPDTGVVGVCVDCSSSSDRSDRSDRDSSSSSSSGRRLSPTTLFIRQGNSFLETGNYAAAEAAYRQAVEHSPRDSHSHWNLAIALTYQGQTQEALDEVREAKRLGFKDKTKFEQSLESTLYFDQGYTALDRRDWKDAEAKFRSSLTLRDQPAAHHNLGWALENQSRFTEAETEYQRASQGYAKNPDRQLKDAENTSKALDRIGPLARQQEYEQQVTRENEKNVVPVHQGVEELVKRISAPLPLSGPGLDVISNSEGMPAGNGGAYGQAVTAMQSGSDAKRAQSDEHSKQEAGICFGQNCPSQPGNALPTSNSPGMGSDVLSPSTLEKMRKDPALNSLLDDEVRAKASVDQTSTKVQKKETALRAAHTEAEKVRLQVEYAQARQEAANARNTLYAAQLKVKEAAKVIEEVELVGPSETQAAPSSRPKPRSDDAPPPPPPM